MINVNKPYLPNIEKYINKIKTIWTTNHLTNYGPLHKELEEKICKYLNIKDVCLINSCSNGLLMCLNEFDAGDEIITTPFSFIATTSSIVWSKLKPVFCDIDPEYLFIDTNKIKSLITPRTKAVLTTHVYGNTGNLEELETICKENNIKLIFDAAHAFGVKYKEKSILEYGDMSILSFHATKVYHTIEGGAIYVKDETKMAEMRTKGNFGYKNYQIELLGINSKMSEFNAAMGLCSLDEIDDIINDRKQSCEYYDKLLYNSYKINYIRKPTKNVNIKENYSYYPIIFNNENDLLICVEKLNSKNIFPRRYFYPSLNTVSYLQKIEMPISESISKRILCLPLYMGISKVDIETITDQI